MTKKAEIITVQTRNLSCFSTKVAAEMLGVDPSRVRQLIVEAKSYGDSHTLLSVGKREGGSGRNPNHSLCFNDVEILEALIGGHRIFSNVSKSQRMTANNPMKR